MICPFCSKDIPDAQLAHHLAAKGGKSRSLRKLKAVRENAAKAREAAASLQAPVPPPRGD